MSLSRSLALNGVMVDVGARYGTALAAFAREGWSVLAFEPDPKNRRVLRAVRFFRRNLQIDERAVADHARQGATLYTSTGRSSISSLVPFDESHAPGASVDVTTLDIALTERNLDRVDVLKVDAEGADLRVLMGLDFAGPRRPSLMICEFDGRKVASGGHTYEDLSGFIASKGYNVLVSEWHPVESYGGRHTWKGVAWHPHELENDMSHGNVIAIDERLHLGAPVMSAIRRWSEAMAARARA